MNVLLLYVNMIEEVIPHKRVVRFWVTFWQVDILVHVERDDILERNFASLVLPYQFLIQAQGRGPRRTSQLERLLWSWLCLFDSVSNIVSRPFREGVIIWFDNYSHTFYVIKFDISSEDLLPKVRNGGVSPDCLIIN